MNMPLVVLILYFFLTGFIGWIYETFVMTVYTGKWDNRGFLYAPFLPIYSVGCVAISFIISTYFPDASRLKIFLIGVVGSAVLEFTTSYVLEKLFHKVWWDYSIAPFNVQGRICAPASIGFGIAAVLVVKVFNPVVIVLLTSIRPHMAIAMAVMLITLGCLDIYYTVKTLKHGFKGFKYYDRFNEKMDSLVEEHWPFESTICDMVHARIDEEEPSDEIL